MDLYQYVLKKVTGYNHNYLFVDEIQEIEEFQLCLRSLLNEINVISIAPEVMLKCCPVNLLLNWQEDI